MLEAISTHRVVKFIVTVRLVENRLKRSVGRVMEVKVTSQYRNVGMKRPRSKSKAPIKPIHDRDVPCCELAKAEIWGSEEGEAEALRVEGGVEAFCWRIESMTEDKVGAHCCSDIGPSRGVRMHLLLKLSRIVVDRTIGVCWRKA